MGQRTVTPDVEAVAMAIFWAAWEMYWPGENSGNPVRRMTKEQAWVKTSAEHRALARFQARRAIETMN